jgi:hypothetical protein
VPLPEGRTRPRPRTSERAETYRELIKPANDAARPRLRTIVQRGAFGLTAVGIAGWLWRMSGQARAAQSTNQISALPSQSRGKKPYK